MMRTKVTETIELTVSYYPNGMKERVCLPDLRDVLTEGSRAFLPFGSTLAPALDLQIKSICVSDV